MFQDLWLLIVAVVFVAINGITMLAWATQMGFKMKPTALAYFFAAIANLFTGNVIPLSGQSSILTVSNFVKNANERVAALIIATVVMVPLGIFGVVSTVVDFAGPPVIFGMMAGVGLMVAGISIDIFKQDKRTGAVAFIFALLTWWQTVGNPHQLVYVIAVSVTAATLDFLFLQKDPVSGQRGRRVNLKNIAKENGFTSDMPEDMEEDENYRFWKKEYWQGFKITKPRFSFMSVYYAFAFVCISLGTIIAFGNITAGMAGVPNPVDKLTVINGLVDIPTVLFGGMPIEVIISATANSPWPVLAGILMMTLLGFLLLFGLVSRLIKFLPAQSIVGFLFIIGFFSTFRPNLVNAFNTALASDGVTATLHTGNTSQAAAALLITAVTKNPFLGLAAGVLVRYIGTAIGLPG
jgi:AGZA family xanthine/uracil permease-like MFS transporter